MGLNETRIRNAKATPGKIIKLSDGEGLQLWIRPSGAKIWNLAYRFENKQRKLNIGTYPGVGLRDARHRRDEAKAQLAEGIDPSLSKRMQKRADKAKKSSTFASVVADLMAKKRREAKAPATLKKLDWLLAKTNETLGPRRYPKSRRQRSWKCFGVDLR